MLLFGIFPILSLLIVFMSPESPHWLIFKGKNEDALKSLTVLRGRNNIEIINTEYESIVRSTEAQSKKADSSINDSEIQKYWKILTDRTFFEPFLLLFLIFAIGLEWGGFPTLAFYMVPFLK